MSNRIDAAETRSTFSKLGIRSWADKNFRQPFVELGRNFSRSNTKAALALEVMTTDPSVQDVAKRVAVGYGGALAIDATLAIGNTTPSLFWKLHDMAIDPQTHSMGELFWADVMAAPTWFEMTGRLTAAGLAAIVATTAFKYSFRRA